MKKIPLRGWFDEPGAYVLVDGQYGSTGKGLLAGWLAEGAGGRITHVTTNAGPNSGHTAYFQYQANTGDYTGEPERVMTQQIPVASVFLHKMGYRPITLLNGGAVIDSAILLDEFTKYDFDTGEIFVHPNAVVIEEEDRRIDKITTRRPRLVRCCVTAATWPWKRIARSCRPIIILGTTSGTGNLTWFLLRQPRATPSASIRAASIRM
jgi:hypothetical protein